MTAFTRETEGFVPHLARSRAQFTRNLRELSATDRSQVGGKAASLGELLASGQAVPEGFAITTEAFKYFLRLAGLTDAVAAFMESRRGDRAIEDAALAKVHARIMAAPMPDELAQALQS